MLPGLAFFSPFGLADCEAHLVEEHGIFALAGKATGRRVLREILEGLLGDGHDRILSPVHHQHRLRWNDAKQKENVFSRM